MTKWNSLQEQNRWQAAGPDPKEGLCLGQDATVADTPSLGYRSCTLKFAQNSFATDRNNHDSTQIRRARKVAGGRCHPCEPIYVGVEVLGGTWDTISESTCTAKLTMRSTRLGASPPHEGNHRKLLGEPIDLLFELY